MKNIKYYALGKKNSPLLKKYFQKFYEKLVNDLRNIKDRGILQTKIGELLKTENREFILNADISSLINSIILDNNIKSIERLSLEIDIFLDEGIDSIKLIQNKGVKIAGTNIKLTNFDNNPYNKDEAHPDHIKQGAISGNWGEKNQDEWLKVYEKSFMILKQLDEGIYDELNQIITKIIPLGTARGQHNSASYKECVGHLYMGYTIDSDRPEINNLEAIIHESSHNKLNLLLHFDPIILNDKQEKYYSAIRPDARHIYGIFFGYHAFAPTMYIIMKAYKDGHLGNNKMWFNKIILYYIKTKFLQKMIKKYAILSSLGKEISREIDYIISEMDNLLKQLKPTKTQLKEAKMIQMQHFAEVNKNYPFLEY